jgi:hypothetical protein
MHRTILLLLISSAILVLAPSRAQAQAPGNSWRPPSRAMPMMPRVADLGGDWLGPRTAWFQDVHGIAGVQPTALLAVGEARAGSEYTQIARFNSGPLPVVVWSDRNGDDRADLIEIFRQGGVIIQLIDADYDGTANVVRIYDAAGKLLREDRL